MKKKPKPGRPPTGRIARNVYLEPKHIEYLRTIGRGNISAGIRWIIENFEPKKGRRK